jgi:hypothetical protein
MGAFALTCLHDWCPPSHWVKQPNMGHITRPKLPIPEILAPLDFYHSVIIDKIFLWVLA